MVMKLVKEILFYYVPKNKVKIQLPAFFCSLFYWLKQWRAMDKNN